MSWETYWLEETDRAARGLRRYVAGHTGGWTCEEGWHSALVWLPGDVAVELSPRGTAPGEFVADPDDGRWPTQCREGCGYRFTEADEKQAWQERLWRRVDTGQLVVMGQAHAAPPGILVAGPGASWDAKWMGSSGPDGICLTVRCPRGDDSEGVYLDWCVDWPSSSGRAWSRVGDPRSAEVTASPSIAIGQPDKPGYYHGWLQDGILSDHLG